MVSVPDTAGYPRIIKEFATYKQTVQGCSAKTVSEYLLDLRTFSRFMVLKQNEVTPTPEAMEKADISGLDYGFFDSVTENDILEFLLYTKNGRENGASARERKLCALRSFYKYATVKAKCLENNPAKDIDSPKKKKQLPKFLSVEECIDLLSAVKNDKESKSAVRDFCILTLFLNCGMRLSELCGISLADIDREMRSLRVVGKGNKERIIYLNSACRDALSEYLPARLAVKAAQGHENALFISRLGKRISPKTVQWMVKKYLGEADLSFKHYSTHKLRHTAATLMYQSGEVDVLELKDILGHEQLNTTQIYTHVSNENLEKAMEHNPLAKVKIEEKKKGKAT